MAARKRSQARAEATPEVAAASEELKTEIEKNEVDDLFVGGAPSAVNRKEVPLDAPFGRIVQKILIDDVEATYDELEKSLKLGDTYDDHGAIKRALDKAETNARKAHSLWMTSKLAKDAYEIDNAPIYGAMRSAATRSLEAEKQAGLRSKQITDADVDARIATLYEADYRAHQLGRRRVKIMDESLGDLASKWDSRCRSLNTMLGKQR